MQATVQRLEMRLARVLAEEDVPVWLGLLGVLFLLGHSLDILMDRALEEDLVN
ncbi:MAG: hypothetical protein QHH05_00660 [Syntrophomonadaceae bacterium]|nr:hypothetical protein [Syntrophomonadaceae bacterium]